MKFKLERYSIQIIPESEEDKAYLEDTIGASAVMQANPVQAFGLSSLAYIEIRRRQSPIQTGGANAPTETA